MKILELIILVLYVSLFSCKKYTQVQRENIERGNDSIVEYKKKSILEDSTITEQYSEVKYTPKVIGQRDNIVVFEFSITDTPIVLYTYTGDYLAYLEIGEKFVPFFNGYFIEYSSNDKVVYKLLDGIKFFKKDNDYLIMFPMFTNEFTLFKLIGFDSKGVVKDFGEHTYDGETFGKIIETPYEERVFFIKEIQDKPRVHVSCRNNDFLFNKVHYRSKEDYEMPSKKQLNYFRQFKTKQKYVSKSFATGSMVYAQVETYLNVRSTPSSSGEILAKAYPTDKLKVLEVLEDWVKIEFNGVEGYVSSDYVSQKKP